MIKYIYLVTLFILGFVIGQQWTLKKLNTPLVSCISFIKEANNNTLKCLNNFKDLDASYKALQLDNARRMQKCSKSQ